MNADERTDVTIAAVNGKAPRIHPSAFIAPGCRIIGDVTIGPDVSVWYNCVLRADVSRIVVGARSNIQDGSVIHCDGPDDRHPEGFPTLIGEDVLIGHMAMIHGAVLHDRAFVGLSTTVMNACVIESDAMLAAGALLSPGKRIPSRQLWAGSPAKYMRDLPEPAIADMQQGVERYVRNGKIHAAALGHGLGASEG